MDAFIKFPKESQNPDKVLSEMIEFGTQDVDWKKGRTFSLVYPMDEGHNEFLKKAHHLYFSENGLNPMAFKSLKKFEHEIIRMCVDLFNGNQQTVGVLTSGGTESLLLAVKTYRDKARALKPWIKNPEMILPHTAHVALDKAAHYFGIKMVRAKVGTDQRIDVKDVKKLINRNTILIIASAPQYPHGVIDPIPALGELALKHNIGLHVDACIGGFILPFLEELGEPITCFDFRVEGVSSLSADIHKYGYAAKGASVVLYRSMNTMKYQFFVATEFPAGIYASPGVLGTRGGGPIAAAWGAIKKLGREGYLKEAKKILEVRNHFLEELKKIRELKLVVHPEASIVAFESADPNISIYAVADILSTKGWNVDRQQNPESIHLTLAPIHSLYIDDYLGDLKEAVAHVRAHPESASSGQAAMYGMMAKIPFRGMIKSSVRGIMEKMYGPESKLPDETSDKVENWGDFAQKVGTNALELKRQMSSAWEKIKNR